MIHISSWPNVGSLSQDANASQGHANESQGQTIQDKNILHMVRHHILKSYKVQIAAQKAVQDTSIPLVN